MADDDIVFGIEGDPDEPQLNAAAERAGRVIGEGIARGVEKTRLGKTLPNILADTMAQKGPNLFERGARQATEAINSLGNASTRQLQSMRADFAALEQRVEATRSTLRAAGADENLFAVIDRQLRITQSTFRDFEQELESGGTLGEERFSRLAEIIKQSNATIQRETAGAQSALRTFTVAQNNATQAQTRAADRAAQERIQAARLAASRILVQEQGLNAERLAEIRIGGRQELAAQQAVSRRRIEIMRFAFQQIKQIERAIAGVFRATGTILTGVAGATSSALNRLGNVFRRTNRDMNDGLQGALNRREQALSRSFRRQTNDIRAEVGRQQQAVDRLERNLSTGVLGVLSGRSRLGGALGAGALIGGGLTAGNLFTQGLDRFQSLERANLQLERLLGSATQAQRLLDGLNQWALGTPLALDLISEIAVGLISMGTAADNVLPRLEAITDAVAFTGGGADEIRRVGLAIRQVASAGRLLGQDFNQITQALPGLNLNQLLADQITGGDTAAFLKLREAGEVTAEQFIEAFVAGVQASDAIGGSTASLASTLQGQISNLNAAWRRLGAAIITEFEGPIRASIARLRDNLSFLGRFVAGDVSENFLRLRGAIAGVAVALGALIAARAAVEVLQLLGVAARFALTPFGALVVAVGALGAAVGALRVANDNFRYITDGIRDLASEQLSRGLGLLADALRRLGGFLVDRVIPALTAFGEQVVGGIVVAVRVLVAIFRAVLIPAFETAFNFFVNTGIPAVINLAASIQQYLIPAAIALGAAWFVAVAPIQVVLGVFAALGAALLVLRSESVAVRNFTDDLASSFQALGTRLLSVARTALSQVADILRAVGDAFVNLLAGIDYERLAIAVLGFVNELGSLLGAAITSRVAVTAGVAIAGVAVALAGSFLAGFAEGVITGLPGAVDQIIDVIRISLGEVGAPGIFTALFSNAFSGIATLIAGAFLASSVLRSFTSAGGRVAGAFSAGLIPGIRTGFTNAFRGIEALAGPERAIRNAAARQAAAYQSEFDRILRNNRRLGFQSTLAAPGGAISRDSLDANAIRRLTAEQERYISTVGRATASATLFRRTWGDALRGTEGRWTALQDRVAQTGGWAAVGQRAGVTLVTAFSAALAGQQGGTAGLVGVVAASLGALAVGGPVVGGITAAFGAASLLWNEINKADEAAKLLAETTERIADTIRGLTGDELGAQIAQNLADAVTGAVGGSGAATLSILPDGFFASTAAEIEQGEFDLERSFASILGKLKLRADQIQDIYDLFELDPEVLRLSLESPDFTVLTQFVGHREVDPIVARTKDDVAALATALADAGVPADQFVAVLSTLQTQALATAGSFELNREQARLLREGLSPIDAGFLADIEARAGGARNELSGLEELLRFETVANSVGRVTGLLDRVGGSARDAFDLIKEDLAGVGISLDDDLTRFIRDLIDEWIRAGLASDQAKRFMKIDEGIRADWEAMAGAVKGVREEAEKLTLTEEQVSAAADAMNSAIKELEQQRSDRIRGQIDSLRITLAQAERGAEQAELALRRFLTGGYADSAQQQVDALIGNLGSIGSRIEEAGFLGGVRGEAAARAAVGDFGSQIASIIQAGIAEGLTTQEQFRGLLGPLFSVLGEEGQDAARRILSTVDFDSGFTGPAAAKLRDELNRILGGSDLEAQVGAVFNARSEVDRIQGQLDRLEAELDVKVRFDESQVRQALADAGASRALVDAIDFSSLDMAQLQGLVAAVAAANQQFAPAAPAQSGGTTYNDNRKVDVIVQGNPSPALTAAQIVARANALIGGRPDIYQSGQIIGSGPT